MKIRIVKAAKNINQKTKVIVEFLSSEGYKIECKPTEKITEEMYAKLVAHFNPESQAKPKRGDNSIEKNLVTTSKEKSNPKKSRKYRRKKDTQENLIPVLGWIQNDLVSVRQIQKKIGLSLRRTIKILQRFSNEPIDKKSSIRIGELKIGIPQLSKIIYKEQEEYIREKELNMTRSRKKAKEKQKKLNAMMRKKKTKEKQEIKKYKSSTISKGNQLEKDTYPILEEPDEYKRSKRIKLIGKYKQ